MTDQQAVFIRTRLKEQIDELERSRRTLPGPESRAAVDGKIAGLKQAIEVQRRALQRADGRRLTRKQANRLAQTAWMLRRVIEDGEGASGNYVRLLNEVREAIPDDATIEMLFELFRDANDQDCYSPK